MRFAALVVLDGRRATDTPRRYPVRIALNELKSFIDAYKDDYLYWVNPLQNSVDIQIPLEKFDSEDSERLYLLLEGISRIVAVDYRGDI